ncbi:Sodium/glutamate symporter [Rubripirellula amarantea]|uniref:Sodium/glutamate symporter n=1 Tax=Rubripirellula amarantea TaxID=2527999 RepID=A0A5C5WT25_9BACT|nr:sodium/glutamate symporter [Rubripirellula amarantea]TWT53223.1 Sodium/glutamate symporter [Rubripirellula amarantea]
MTLALIATAVLLLFALALHSTFAIFRWLYLPISVTAGFIGLVLVLTASSEVLDSLLPGHDLTAVLRSVTGHWRSWPGTLIAIVFAGMLLERPSSSAADSLRRAGREGLMVWIIVLGQTAIGLALTLLWIQPRTGVPDAFGMLIETGFAGGHGTAAAMGQVFESEMSFLSGGRDLGVTMATIGLVYGVISGVVWVNLGIRRGWTRPKNSSDQQDVDAIAGDETANDTNLEQLPSSRGPAIEPLLLQMIWLTIAFAIGWLLQASVGELAEWIETAFNPASSVASEVGEAKLHQKIQLSEIVNSFPLFIYTLLGGWIVRWALSVLGISHWIDGPMISRICSMAMDILVVAAIASLDISIVSGQFESLLVLVIGGSLWTAFCLLVLSRQILPREHWFELGLINYGMSTGTTATGFVLLRMIDPKLESGAAEDYALAAPLSSPFIGGGMITIGLPILILGKVPLAIVVLSLIAIVLLLIVAARMIATKHNRSG